MRVACFFVVITMMYACGSEGGPYPLPSGTSTLDEQNGARSGVERTEPLTSVVDAGDEMNENPADAGRVEQETPSGDVDDDSDGFSPPWDCDDHDFEVHPNAMEICNDRDDNCDGQVDEEAGSAVYEDLDGDGFGDDGAMVLTCAPADDAVFEGGDCDDSDPLVFPGSSEMVDGVDSDCDGKKDWLVTIYSAVDDAGEICVDTEDPMLGSTGGWVDGSSMEIWLESGTHAVGIHGWDLGKVITAAIAHLETSEGMVVVTDDTWRYDPNPQGDGESRLGWCAPFFDDSAWSLAKDIGPIGDSDNPWQDAPSIFPDGSPAHWIWDHFPVDLNTQYLRQNFELP